MSAARESLARRALWSAQLAWNAPLEARFPFRPPEAIERAQRRRLASIVAHAHRHVPYYRETMRRLGLAPEDFRSADDLAKLPLIERNQLQRDPEYFRSRAWPADTYLRLRSGGSTGEPITVFRHPFALFQGAAHRERIRSTIARLVGARIRFRVARIALPHEDRTRHEFARRTLVPPSVRVVRAHLSLLNPPAETLEHLNRVRPDVIATYGSYLEALFAHLHATGEPFHRPKVVAYGGDSLSDRMRALIGELGIEVFSAYGSIEEFHIGFECERHKGHHLNIDLCPVRIVEPGGDDLPLGESGEVVISNLYAHGTVLLNYRLGDLAARLPQPCPCGRSLPLLSMVRGRTNEWLAGAGGEPVHGAAIRDVMRQRDDVLRYQVIQEETRQFGVSLVVTPGCERDSLATWLEAQIRERFGDDTTVRVSFPNDLPRTRGGKVRPVVSLVT